MKLFAIIILIFSCSSVFAKELQTNSTYSADVPAWVTKGLIDKTTDRIQNFMEWSIRRVTVVWYKDQAAFEKEHKMGALVMAVSRKSTNTILVGPKVTIGNFDRIFGHELVHVISYQKYKEAIPRWLEEGLANYVAKNGQVDYKWLATRPFPEDIRQMTHPFSGSSDYILYHYTASQALAEMLAKKCDLRNLLRLSVGTKMDGYLVTYCQIPDLNAAFKKWVQEKAK